jgi:hypothetical protein
MVGISIHIYTTKEEIINGKNGVSTIIGWSEIDKPENAKYCLMVPTESCDILENEIRVNVSKALESIREAGTVVGKAVGEEIEKVFKQFG